MIYELRSNEYLEQLKLKRELKESISYLESLGMNDTLNTILEDIIIDNQSTVTYGKIEKNDNYIFYYKKYTSPIRLSFDGKSEFIIDGYCITKTGKVVLRVTNYKIVIVLDVTLPYFSSSVINVYDSVVFLDKISLPYFENVQYV